MDPRRRHEEVKAEPKVVEEQSRAKTPTLFETYKFRLDGINPHSMEK